MGSGTIVQGTVTAVSTVAPVVFVACLGAVASALLEKPPPPLAAPSAENPSAPSAAALPELSTWTAQEGEGTNCADKKSARTKEDIVLEAQSALEEKKKSLQELRQEMEEVEGFDTNVYKNKKTQVAKLGLKIKTAEGKVAAAERNSTTALNAGSAKHKSDARKQACILFLARAYSLCLCVFVSHSRDLCLFLSFYCARTLSLVLVCVSLSDAYMDLYMYIYIIIYTHMYRRTQIERRRRKPVMKRRRDRGHKCKNRKLYNCAWMPTMSLMVEVNSSEKIWMERVFDEYNKCVHAKEIVGQHRLVFPSLSLPPSLSLSLVISVLFIICVVVVSGSLITPVRLEINEDF